MSHLRFAFLVSVIIGLSFSLPLVISAFQPRDTSCVKSFQEFAYNGPGDRTSRKTLPLPPWELESSIPAMKTRDFNASVIRSKNDQQEIWLIEAFPYNSYDAVIMVYNTSTKNWETISGYIAKTSLSIKQLFVTRDGEIWGKVETQWISRKNNIYRENIPVLSKFNESTRFFELTANVPEIPLLEEDYLSDVPIVLDSNDTFWIFQEDGKIIHYYPEIKTTELLAQSLDSQPISAALSHDESIYVETRKDYNVNISQGTLFELSLATQELNSVELPTDWPNYSGLLADSTGRIWLGAIGHRNLNNQWNLTYLPYILTSMNNQGKPLWATPRIMSETSDGRLWYQKYLDTDGWGEGTAWYNPETQQGCLFTTFATTIVEDLQGQLWLAAGGKLYLLKLNS